MNIVESKFIEWTRTKDERKKRISVFERVREIPYAIQTEQFSPEKGPAELLKKNKGFCISKHYFLGMAYERLKIPVKYCTYLFRWDDLDVAYPVKLKKRAKALPCVYHLACKILINGKWILVDATWDKVLKDAGFPVNKKWDGETDTLNAVNPLKEFIHESASERAEKFNNIGNSYKLSEKIKLLKFSREFNKWLEELRS